jgi:hypothetical protein
MFAKVFSQIFDSSIAMDHVVRHVFMDMLVLADRDGVVDMTQDAIARRTNVPLEIIMSALERLSQPDDRSRSGDEEGRRIVLIDSHRDWGWQIVNYHHYRDLKDEEARRQYFRDKKREQRARQHSHTLSNGVKDSPRNSTQAEAEAEAEVNTKTPLPPRGGRGRFEPGLDKSPVSPAVMAEMESNLAGLAKVKGKR